MAKRGKGAAGSRRVKSRSNLPFKSGLEKALSTAALKEYGYEPPGTRIAYQVEHMYYPDFIHPKQPDVLVEVKGYMRHGSADCKKYVAIAKTNPDKEIVFIFSNPEAKAYAQCRRRRDGTFLTLGEWAKKNGFLFFSPDKIPKSLAEGKLTVEDIRAMKIKRGYN
jgi:hypothetical protein